MPQSHDSKRHPVEVQEAGDIITGSAVFDRVDELVTKCIQKRYRCESWQGVRPDVWRITTKTLIVANLPSD